MKVILLLGQSFTCGPMEAKAPFNLSQVHVMAIYLFRTLGDNELVTNGCDKSTSSLVYKQNTHSRLVSKYIVEH